MPTAINTNSKRRAIGELFESESFNSVINHISGKRYGLYYLNSFICCFF